jgi:hypothetical protein
MTFPHPTVARLLACAALALSLVLPEPAAAQEDAGEPRRFCYVGRPLPSCEMMLVAQFSYYPRIQRFSDLDAPYEWEAGVLVNRGPNHAIGGTLVVGLDGNGGRAAVKGRYRRWMGRHAALDASGGVALARRDWAPTVTTRNAVGLTGDVAVGLTDWASVGVRGDLLWSHLDREPVGATYVTVRLGTVPGVVASLLGAVFAVVVVSASG